MYMTHKFLDLNAKEDAVKANLTDMIVGYILDQLTAGDRPVRTSEDLDELVQQTRTWLALRTNPTAAQISDFACKTYDDFTG